MRSVIGLLALAAAVSFAAVAPPTASASECRLLSDHSALAATGEKALLETDISAGGNYCKYKAGDATPAEVPALARVQVTLELVLFRLTRASITQLVELHCTLVAKGYYSAEACAYAKQAKKADDPQRRFQLLHRSLLEMGDGYKIEGLGAPAFEIDFSPPLVGTELWVYLADEKKVLVVTCVKLGTAADPSGGNGHFHDCAFPAAHGAVVRLR